MGRKSKPIKHLNDIHNAPLSRLLRQTLSLAKSIGDQQIESWARLELDGYYTHNPAMTEQTVVPEYRTVGGQYSDIYGRPLILQDSSLQFILEDRLRNGIPELERLAKSHSMLTIRNPHTLEILKKHLQVDVHNFSFSPSSIEGILSVIRTKLMYKLGDLKYLQSKQPDSGVEVPVGDELCNLHPKVREVAGKLFYDGHYRQAILDTYISLVEAVKAKSAVYNPDGSALMQKAFSAKNPILRVSSDPDEQLGYMSLFSGAAMAVRNPRAHKISQQGSRQHTLELLFFASHLFQVLDSATLERTR